MEKEHQTIIQNIRSPLFEGIRPEEREKMLACIGYRISTFPKGSILVFEKVATAIPLALDGGLR